MSDLSICMFRYVHRLNLSVCLTENFCDVHGYVRIYICMCVCVSVAAAACDVVIYTLSLSLSLSVSLSVIDVELCRREREGNERWHRVY